MGLAAIVEPLLGGFMTDNYSWRWTFYVNLPVGIAALLVLYFAFPAFEAGNQLKRAIDWAGVATLILCLVPLMIALESANNLGWTSPLVLGLLAFGLLMIPAFLLIESRAAEPLVPLSLFGDRVISVSLLAVFLLGLGMFGVILYVPLFAQGVLGTSASESGSLLTPLMLTSVVTSIAAGQIMSRTDPARETYARQVGEDGFYLLKLLSEKPPALLKLEQAETLEKVWQRHYARHENGEVNWVANAELAKAATAIESPYDTEAGFSTKRDLSWTGYKVHLSETCDEQLPRLITNVHTTVATTQDVSCTDDMQKSMPCICRKKKKR